MISNLKQYLDQSGSIASSLLSLKEYLSNNIEKFKRITSGYDSTDEYISIPVDFENNNQLVECVGFVKATDVYKAFHDELDTVECIVQREGSNISLTADRLINIVEQEIGETQVQSEFLTVCLSNDSVTSASFTSSVLAKFPAVSPSMVENYARCFSIGDKIEALKSWISQSQQSNVVDTDVYIETVNRSEYTGVSVWNVVIDDFIESINNLFEKAWQGIQDIFGFFERLWQGICKLGKYLIAKAFRYLASNLANGESKIGIFDFPIIQFQLGTLSDTSCNYGPRSFAIHPTVSTWLSQVTAIMLALNILDCPAISGRDIARNPLTATGKDWLFYNRAAELQKVMDQFVNANLLTTSKNPDTGVIEKYLLKPFDTTFPISDNDVVDGFVLRFGVTQNNKIFFQLFPQMKQQVLDYYSDAEVYTCIVNAFKQMLYDLNNKLYFMVRSIHSDGTTNAQRDLLDPEYLTAKLFSPLTVDEQQDNAPIDFASHFQVLSITDAVNLGNLYFGDPPLLNVPWASGVAQIVFYGFVAYASMMSPCAETNFYSSIQSNQRVLDPVWLHFYGWVADWWAYVADDFSSNLPLDWNTTYKPYLSYSITPSSIHYQSISERAKEIEWTILAVIIAAAVTVVTIKSFKFIKKLKVDTEIAEAQRDSFSWEMDPTDPSDVAQYKKLRRKARKLERLSGIFGRTSQVASNALTSKNVDGNVDTTVSGIGDIRNLIAG